VTEQEVIANEEQKAVTAQTTPVDPNTQSTPTNYPSSKFGIVLLGLYLILTLGLSLSLLFVLMKAKDISETVKSEVSKETAEKIADHQSADSAGNTNSNAVNANVGNANTSNTNTANTASAQAKTADSNAAVSGNTKTPTTTPTSSKTPSTVTPTPDKTATPKQTFYKTSIPKEVRTEVFGDLSGEGYLFLVVLFAGMTGGIIRGIHSFFKHLGLGDFSFKWTWYYVMLPFIGSSLSIVLYLVIRGGFFTSSYGESLSLNLFSFAALGTLTGLFSENAMEKLRQTASVLLSDVPPKIPNSKQVIDNKHKNDDGK
jgi:hypothetical protein